MRYVGRTLVLVGLLSMGGCGGTHPPRVVEPLPHDEPITVVAFVVDPAGVRFEGSVDAMGLALAGEVAERLRRKGRTAESVAALPAEPRGTMVRGRITTVDGGSRAARFWVGFGAGGASVAADGEVVRADGSPVAPFKVVRSSSGMADLFGGDSPVLVDKCVRAIGGDIAEMVDTGHYEQE